MKKTGGEGEELWATAPPSECLGGNILASFDWTKTGSVWNEASDQTLLQIEGSDLK